MISEKRLHGVVSLTGTNFQKQGRDVFFFCSITYTGLLEGRVILLRIASQQAETKPAPVCDFESQVGK